MQDKVHILSDIPGERLAYACQVVFGCVLRIPYVLHRGSSSIPADAPCIYYSTHPPHYRQGVFWLQSTGLLQQKDIRPQAPPTSNSRGVPILYPALAEGASLDFDVLSAVFFMASRYEEYLPYTPDMYGRFPEKASITHRLGCTQKAIVHHWCSLLAAALQKAFPGLQLPVYPSGAVFTYDIDVAYAYRGRPMLTHLLSMGKDVLEGNLPSLRAKWKYRFGLRGDPWDCYDTLLTTPVQQRFFFLAAARRSPYDRNIDPQGPLLQQLIRRLAHKAPVGMHPSYLSSEQPQLLVQEKASVEKACGQPITLSRQHYLRFRLPQYARQLLALGIQHDYSMQYPEVPGFRAGLCVSFPFFDLESNTITPLMLHPGCIMDTTFRDDLHLPPHESLPWYMQCSAEVQRWGGTFISIWHNDMLGTAIWPQYPHSFAAVHATLLQHWPPHP